MQAQDGPEEADLAEEPFDFVLVLKTESCKVWRALAHLGQAIFADLDITSCS